MSLKLAFPDPYMKGSQCDTCIIASNTIHLSVCNSFQKLQFSELEIINSLLNTLGFFVKPEMCTILITYIEALQPTTTRMLYYIMGTMCFVVIIYGQLGAAVNHI